ncbi:hypothetical protein CUN31_03425 [Enterococcus faecalis]|nr:hypothetical protein [Enterococcus faecalis]EGO7617900.1 hypothetical protein [Enterococcus faecalis]EGO7913054.1 hypothetical protein [Enterococcus faecalis]EHZ2968490.1 hypothetical protein [Enterococcus faecalis]EIB6795297.1 hypothetical protein [Enterococcus faecalis]PQB33935.1 hypothetical protein CUN31_03425 [Enterococcus faecalis]
MNGQKLQVEITHTLTQEQLQGIYKGVYITVLKAIEDARRDSEIENDLLFSKSALRKFLNNCSDPYVEELLAKGLPRGRTLSDRKAVFSKKAVKAWLLENEI